MTDKPRPEAPEAESSESERHAREGDSGQPESQPNESPEVSAASEQPEQAPAPELTAEERIAELTRESKQNYDRMLRVAADLENYRKRARRDVEDAKIAGQSGVLREVVPVIDNLERALAHAGSVKSEEARSIADGVGLVLRQFAQALERCGVVPVSAEGEFDPTIHEAVSQIEAADVPPGTIAEVLQRGYKIGDRLFRPALVVVTKAPAQAATDDASGNGAAPEENGAGPAVQNGHGN